MEESVATPVGIVGDADVLHQVTPGGHYIPVPRRCLEQFCEHIGLASGSTAQDNFLRAVDHREPLARQYKVSRGYRRPANVVVLQKVNSKLEPDLGRQMEFVTGEASINGHFPAQFFSEAVQKLDDMKPITQSEIVRLVNGSLPKQRATGERARQVKGWTVLHLTDEEKIARMRAQGRYRPLSSVLSAPRPEPAVTAAAEGPAPEQLVARCALEAEAICAAVKRLLSDAELVDVRPRLDMVLLENEILVKKGRALQIELAGKTRSWSGVQQRCRVRKAWSTSKVATGSALRPRCTSSWRRSVWSLC
jgi:hypothetical protein